MSDGTTTATITSAGALTGQPVLDGVNNTAGLKVRASLTADGKLQLEATSTSAITLGGTASAAELAQFGLMAGVTAAGTLVNTRSASAQFDAIRSQMDQLATDATFNAVVGVNDTSVGLGVVASANTTEYLKD